MRLRGPLAGEVRARTLHGLVVGLLLYIWIVHIPVIVPLFVARKAGSTLANVYLTLIYGITLALLRRGSLRQASVFFLAGTWIAATVFIVFGGGIQSTALVHYVNLPILAAWLLGASAAGVMTAICLGGSLLLAVLAQSGYVLPQYFPGAPFGNWSSVAMATLGTVVPVLFVLNALNEALEKRQGAEEALRQANEKLEKRVLERTAQLEEANDFLQIHLSEQKRLETGLELAARFPGENPNPVMRLGQGHLVDFANPAAQALLRTLGCAVAGEAPADIAEPAVAALKDGVPRQIEKTYSERTYLFSFAPIAQWGYVTLYATDITDRKRAEGALRASEQRFRALSEAMPQIVWSADASGTLEYVNPFALKYCGAGMDALHGWNWASFVHPDDLMPMLAAWRRLLSSGQSDQIEHRLRRADREFRWHVAHAVALRDANGELIQWIGTITDIHDRKMAEHELERRIAERTAELRESQALMKSIVDSTPDYIWSVDPERFGLLTFNAAMREFFLKRGVQLRIGMRPEEVFVDQSVAARWNNMYERALAEGSYSAEYESSAAGSMLVTVNLLKRDGKVFGISVFSRDLTERKRVEAALEQSEARYKDLISHTSEGVWRVELEKPLPIGLPEEEAVEWYCRNGYIAECNAAHARLFGFSDPAELTGKRLVDVMLPSDVGRMESFRSMVRGGFQSRTVEIPSLDAGGNVKHLLRTEVPIVEDGLLLRVWGITRDISELKQSESELRRLNRALRLLSSSNQALVRIQNESQLPQEICRILVEEGGYRMAWMGFAEHDADKTLRPVASAGTEEGYLASVKLTWADTERGQGPGGVAIRTGQPSVCNNIMENPQFAPWREDAFQRGYASTCVIPMTLDDQTMAILAVYSPVPDAFDAAEVKLLKELVDDITYGFHVLHTRAERQQAMETLEKHSAQLAEQARLLELAPVAVLVRDLESRVAYWNRGAEEIYGWTSAEASGKVTHTLLQTKFPDPLSEMEAKIFSGVTWQGELTHHKRTGEEVVVVSRQVLRRDKHGEPTGYLEINFDISARKQAEEALKAERQRFFAVLETLPPMICLLTPDYHVAFANRAFLERFGESQGRRCYDYCFGNSAPCEFCQTYDVFKTGQPRHWEVNCPDGSVIDVYDFPFTDAGGAPLILEMDIDITEAKRAKEGLETANAYNRSLLEASLDPLVTISPNGKITDVNSAAETVTGRLREELIGADFSDYFTDPEKARLGYQQVFKEGFVQDYELEVRHRDGSTTPVLYNGSVYRDQGGEVVGVFAAARDITTRKRAEEEVRRLNEELEQRVRLRTAQLEASNKELESFSYSVSHDLRAPLRAMDGFSRILLEEYRPQLPSKAQRYLDFVRDGASHMGNLIDGLLALSRLGRQELKRRPVEVAEIVRQSMDDLQADVEGSAAEFVVGSLPSCDADPLLLRQVFVNLLSNALKFSRKQEKVRIQIGALRAHEAARAPVQVLRLLDPHSWVYYVRDNGVGFDMRYADKLFGVFQRLHRLEEFKGTGIGLATVQQIIHKHGGQVWAEAQVGKGATFYFTLGQAIGESHNSPFGTPE